MSRALTLRRKVYDHGRIIKNFLVLAYKTTPYILMAAQGEDRALSVQVLDLAPEQTPTGVVIPLSRGGDA